MKKIVTALTASALLLSSLPSALAADLLVATATTDPAVEYVRSMGIMKDDVSGSFAAEKQLSKADFIVGVVEHFYQNDSLDSCYTNIASRLPPDFTKLFTDVPTSAWYAKHVCLGMFLGLVNGNKDGSFKPLKAVTNAEAATIVAKTYGLVYPSLRETRLKWFETPMWVLRQQGALPARIDPAAPITRGQLASMFYALRNQRRFPAERTFTPATSVPASGKRADTVPTFIIPVRAPQDGNSSVDIYFITPAAEPQAGNESSLSVPWTNAETVARTHRGPKVSRRQLLMQVEGR